MRKFIFVSLFALSLCGDAWACVSEAPTHNSYVFSVFRRESMELPFSSGINSYWKNYAGDPSDNSPQYYKWYHDRIDSVARSRGDVAMQKYMQLLDRYLTVCDEVSLDAWEYPTLAQIVKRKSTLQYIRKNAWNAVNSGSGMKEQNVLMVMRANMMLNYDQVNIDYWNSTASALPKGVWRDAARNIYARALYKTGKRLEACNIYAEQGDMQSIKWIMRKYRNLAGIKNVYASEPNAYSLLFLVQDFVNNVQETLDETTDGKVDADWVKMKGAEVIAGSEAKEFVAFADKVIAEGKTSSPCLWQSAAAMVEYLLGNTADASARIDKAMNMNGTQRMKDNARCIRLLVKAAVSPFDADFMTWMAGEFRWLDGKIAEERGSSAEYANHYTDVKERIAYRVLAPRFSSEGRQNVSFALYGMMEENSLDFSAGGKHSDAGFTWGGSWPWNMDYTSGNEYFGALSTASADSLAAYYSYLLSAKDNAFEQYVAQQVYGCSDYYNDLIGTRYMAEGRFADALPYLEKVSLGFLSQQNISWYMANRKYSLPRWFNRQLPNMPDTDGPGKGEPKENMKLKYCKDMLQLQANYDLAREGEQKDMRAYELAVMHYQASCYGDCWFLTHYGHSIYDSTRNGEFDFARKTVEYLNKCVVSSDLNMRYKALYALAFVDKDPWFDVKYDSDYNPVYIPRPASSQYKAMSALYSFARQHPQYVDGYTTRCDMLKAFARVSGQ